MGITIKLILLVLFESAFLAYCARTIITLRKSNSQDKAVSWMILGFCMFSIAGFLSIL